MERRKLLLVTTTSETFATILQGQPGYLSEFFDVAICCSPDSHFDSLSEDGAVSVFPVDMTRGIGPLHDIASITGMIKVIRAFKPDIVHSYTPKAGLVAMVASWICRVPVRIHTFTGLLFPSVSGLRRKLFISVDSLIARLATDVVPESQGVRKDLYEHHITDERADVIGHGNIAGVDTAHFSPGRPDISGEAKKIKSTILRNSKFNFCYVGRINRDKGINELAYAFRKLPSGAALVVVGELDETAPPEPGVLECLEADPRVHLMGFQKDVRPFILACDVLVLPSYREGFPNVVLQALSLEKPVIVTDVSGANEITISGRNGWIVPVKNSKALLKAMKEALRSSPEKRTLMGRRGRRLVLSRHERSFYMKCLCEFYDSLYKPD